MQQTLILVRGLPGSGKSTLAEEISSNLDNVHIEADMYFLDEDGKYRFDGTKLKDAHEWCQRNASFSLSLGFSVIVSNTFTQKWEMEPYLKMAEEFNIPVQIIECKGKFGNIHNVPEEAIQKMRERWENV